METARNGLQGPSAPEARPAGSRRWHRPLAAAICAAALLCAGAAIGVAVTGGAFAATGAVAARRGPAARHCAALAARIRHDHPVAARRLTLFCHNPLVRLAAVGGAHGEVTFAVKGGTKTIAFERGTIESATASVITVRAADGATWTWTLATWTIVRDGRHRVSAGRLAQGDQVFVGGQVVSGANDARLIRIRPSA
ncbi:MAG: hypothetical protein ACLQFR_06320 [Streptosporangiaceae bacterium]